MSKPSLPPIISIVGPSGAGKTRLIEQLIPILKQRGYRLGIAKHSLHQLDTDRPGKDSWRFTQAGADTVVVSSPRKWVMTSLVSEELPLGKIRRLMPSVDIVIAEGYHKEYWPKIAVLSAEVEAAIPAIRKGLLAVVGPPELTAKIPVPAFSPDDITEVADFIQSNFLNKK